LSGIGGANAIKGTPESRPKHLFNPLRNALVSWNSPATNKLLLEGAASFQGLKEQTEIVEGATRDNIGITDVGLGLEYGGLAGGGLPTAIRSMAPPNAVTSAGTRAASGRPM
jgi:hypothetical protein